MQIILSQSHSHQNIFDMKINLWIKGCSKIETGQLGEKKKKKKKEEKKIDPALWVNAKKKT